MPPLKNRLTIPRMPKRFPDFKLWVWDCLRLIARQAGTNVQIEGATSSSVGVDGEQYFKAPGSAATATHPFLCPATGGDDSVIEGGTVNGVSATGLTLDISTTGTQYVYLDVTMARDVSANGYVTGFAGAITCALATGSSIPADSSTHLYRLVATYVDGVKTTQDIASSMEVAIRDNGSGSSTAVALWGRA